MGRLVQHYCRRLQLAVLMKMNNTILKYIAIAVAITAIGYIYGERRYNNGYKVGYDIGYADAMETVQVPIEVKPDTVQTVATVQTVTETVVRPKTKPDEPSVVIKTKEPEIVASVNGKKYDFKPTHELLETGIKTTGVISVKVPERKYSFGIGYGKDKKVSYMLKVPVKNAVGLWVAGSGKKNFMGGVSISF